MKRLSLILVSVALVSFITLSACKSKTQPAQEQETEQTEQTEQVEQQPTSDTAAGQTEQVNQ